MTVEIQCESLASFDPASGRYVKCGAVINADPGKAGQSIQCPECGNRVQVPYGSGALPAATEALSQPSTPVASSAADTPLVAPLDAPLENSTSTTNHTNQTPQQAAQVVQPGGAEEGQTLQYSQYDSLHACRSCGAQIRPDMAACPSCGRARRVIPHDEPLDKIKIMPAGFQLWCIQLMASENSFTMVLVSLSILIGAFFLTFSIVAILFLGWFAIPLIMPLIVIVGIYAFGLFRLQKMQSKPALPLYSWQKVIWNLVCLAQRSMNWRSPFRDRTYSVVKVGPQDLRGQDLNDIPGVSNSQVLDLDGAKITDEELKMLRYALHLKMIVLLNTQVTDEGVFRLQQALPKAWIWY